jgi:hypothetical protein
MWLSVSDIHACASTLSISVCSGLSHCAQRFLLDRVLLDLESSLASLPATPSASPERLLEEAACYDNLLNLSFLSLSPQVLHHFCVFLYMRSIVCCCYC